MSNLWLDLRHAARALARHRGFTAVAVLVLALGIGVNTAIFSVVNAVFLADLPVRNPEQLRWVIATVRNPQSTLSPSLQYRDFAQLREASDLFDQIAGYSGTSARLDTVDGGGRIRGERVSANYFDVLGVAPVLGRTFARDEDDRRSPPVIVISHQLWRGIFESDPHIVGRQVRLDDSNTASRGQLYTIVGIMPEPFKGILSPWEPTQFWVPTVQRAVDLETWCVQPEFAAGVLTVVGRVRAGVTPKQLAVGLADAADAIQRTNPKDSERYPGWTLIAQDSRQIPNLPFAGAGRVVPERIAIGLLAVSTLVLLSAVTNLTGVLMARGVRRRGELGVRLMLGAGPWRIVQQVLIEGLTLAIGGGVVGFGLAQLLLVFFQSSTPDQLGAFGSQSFVDVSADSTVAWYTAGLCVLTGVLVSLGPARQAWRLALLGAVSNEAIAAPQHSRALMRQWIVIPQVCVSIVLLVVASALVRVVLRSELATPGYESGGVAFVDFHQQHPDRCADRAAGQQFLRAQDERLLRLSAGLTDLARELGDAVLVGMREMLPHGRGMRSWFVRVDAIADSSAHRWVATAMVSPGYFRMFAIPIRGRDFEARDDRSASRVAIVSEELAHQLWPGRDPIGERLTMHEPGQEIRTGTVYTVVGVARDVSPAVADNAPRGRIYFPIAQSIFPNTIVTRSPAGSRESIRAVTGVIRQIDHTIEIVRTGLVTEAISEVTYPRRMGAALVGGTGVIALAIACLGLYGLVSFAVAQRVRELGIRAALGAARADLVRLIVADGVKVVLMGAGTGVILALAATRVASATIVPLPILEPTDSAAIAAVFAAIILIACYIPARRAASVDPVVALRDL